MQYFISYITLHYYSRWARFSYRAAFFSAAVTYGVVVYKAYRARMRSASRQAKSPLVLVTDENVQYLGRWRRAPRPMWHRRGSRCKSFLFD